MASNRPDNLDIFNSPQCLIDTGRDSKLEIRPDVLEELRSVEKPLVVIAIAGLYRTGKSYLMNRLAGNSSGKGPFIANICGIPSMPQSTEYASVI